MVRKREMMLVAAAVAATLMLGGCDRPDSSQPRAVTPSYDGGTARPVDKSADAMADRSASMATDSPAGTAAADKSTNMATADRSADTAAAGKSADTGATLVAAARDDAAITAKVTQSIKADAALKSLPIQVDTKDGVVTLSGMVDTPDMRLHAHEIAAATSGVARVVDNLTVKSAG